MCRADFEIDVLAAGFTTQGGVMMRRLSIAIGLAATLVLSSSSSSFERKVIPIDSS